MFPSNQAIISSGVFDSSALSKLKLSFPSPRLASQAITTITVHHRHQVLVPRIRARLRVLSLARIKWKSNKMEMKTSRVLPTGRLVSSIGSKQWNRQHHHPVNRVDLPRPSPHRNYTAILPLSAMIRQWISNPYEHDPLMHATPCTH